MATISLALTSVITRSKTISPAHATRVLDAYRVIFGQVSNGAGGLRARTDQEVFDALADSLFNEVITATVQREADTAKASITPIVLT